MHTNPELLALLALGEDAAAAEDRAHLAGCPDCRAELESFAAVTRSARRAGETGLVFPRPEVWQSISRELDLRDPPAPLPERAATPLPAARPAENPGSVRAAAFVLAAALALAVGIGVGSNLDRVSSGGKREVASVALNALPAWTGSSGQAAVEEDEDGNRILVVTVSSPLPATGPREVWMTTSTAEPMIALGYLQDNEGRFPIAPSVDLNQFRLIDISQEPAGDEDFRHSGNSMLRGKLPI